MSARRFRAVRPASVLALLLPLLAAGCDTEQAKFPPACPQLSLLQDAADLTRFAGSPGQAHDARSLVLAARITAVPANCEPGGADTVKARLQIVADVRRGPANPSREAKIPYFVALTEGGKILDEKDDVLTATFRPNVDQVRATSEELDLLLPVTKKKSAAAYHLYVGFRLTPAELTYNRQTAGLE